MSDAIVLYLKRYPGKNQEKFDSYYESASGTVRERVRAVLDEAMQIEPDWDRLSLNEVGDYVESVMHDRHPELTSNALEAIGNYYTFLMR
ncbi:hypothetical protein [Mycobacterium genavense]|uniref:hypothetical protein n=1 Tax=Mycobacterium genavense TaxID=36812 RepID=UPI001FE105AF|nr:hypothetical protein [Mycobacterium genavense]